jgi:hypothetical protein
MDGWASDLDLTFKRLTNGETDITGASQFEFVRNIFVLFNYLSFVSF